MSSSPTFILDPTSGVEEEEMLAIAQGRSHTPPPGSRPSSRLEILMMDLVRSQAEMARSQGDMARSQEESKNKLKNLTRSQAEQSRSTEGKLESLARSQAEQSRSTKEQMEERFESFARAQSEQLAHITGRLSSLEVSRHGTPSPSPNPGRRGSPSSAETMHVSVPSTSGDLVPLSQAEVRRSERLMLKPRPDYRLLNRSATRPDKSVTAIEEDAEY